MSESEMSNWADRAMYVAEDFNADEMNGPQVTLLTATPDPLGAVAAMCAMYEGRVVRSLSELTDHDRKRYWDELMNTHLQMPLESVSFLFLIEGVTRAFTHQLVTQRVGVARAQESLRFAVKEEIAARPGPITAGNKSFSKRWQQAIDAAWDGYRALIAAGVPAEEARGLLPHDTLTRVQYHVNLRALAEHAGNRLCTQAQFEWRLVYAQMVDAIDNYKPPRYAWQPGLIDGSGIGWQFKTIATSELFRPVCFSVGRCPFKASFDRGCTIRGRVDEGRFDEIETREWMADPTAAWVR